MIQETKEILHSYMQETKGKTYTDLDIKIIGPSLSFSQGSMIYM